MILAQGHLLIIQYSSSLTTLIKSLFIKSENYWKRFKGERISFINGHYQLSWHPQLIDWHYLIIKTDSHTSFSSL